MAGPYYINPAILRNPKEAEIIGRLVLAGGELEYVVAGLAGQVIQNIEAAFRVLYSIKQTSARIEAAMTLIRPVAHNFGVQEYLSETEQAIAFSLKIRNQYAHCNWDTWDVGLFFANPEDSILPDGGFEHFFKHVDVELLKQQENWVGYTNLCLLVLQQIILDKFKGLSIPPSPMPPKPSKPSLHNLASKYIPEWLSADQQARHRERAHRAENRLPTPTGAHRAMEAKRSQKREKKQADRDRDRPSP